MSEKIHLETLERKTLELIVQHKGNVIDAILASNNTLIQKIRDDEKTAPETLDHLNAWSAFINEMNRRSTEYVENLTMPPRPEVLQ